MNLKKIIFALLFTVFGILLSQIKLTNLAGSNVNFTMFDAYAPITGSFLGTIWGIISVALIQLANLLLNPSAVVDWGFIIRLLPTAFAVIYFSKKTKFNWIIPIIAIIAFNLHPIGKTVWFYSLFWLIPVIANFFWNKSLIVKSLGATFAAHSVGGAIWIYMFNLSTEVWISLIPVVMIERLMFAAGIAGSYLITKKIVEYLPESVLIN